jgi:hypothetical protein
MVARAYESAPNPARRAMSKYAIDPNAIPDLHAEEVAALDRDNAALHHFDDGGDPKAVLSEAGLPPLMTTPDPRYPHGDVDAIEARLAELKKERAATASPAAAKPGPEAGATATAMLTSLFASLPPPGASWNAEGRADWLRAAESIFHLIYKSGGRVAVSPETPR